MGFPGGASGKEPTCQCRRLKRCRFHLWVGKIPWRRAWQPTPVFLSGESRRQRSLVGCSLWGHKKLDTTELTYQAQHVQLIDNAVAVSGGQQRDSARHMHVSILPQTPLPSRLPHDTEQS